ncbi:hypothetical protein CDAR_471841 [Caerostris darwini]|uniref:Uncharacterized protein n=1 Tax=Caerostris darwini TaxID=1538125 RepID=A0AAV4RT20_9ARAC|nr:hypothetical protein CDAR_471841 [Caerostris darwini]
MHSQQNSNARLSALNPQRLGVTGRNLSPPADKCSSVIIADNYRKQGHWEEGSLFVCAINARLNLSPAARWSLFWRRSTQKGFCCVLLIITFGNDHFSCY